MRRRDVHHQIHHPDSLEPRELDRYLSEGWYRMGQSMITCRFANYGDEAQGVLWTRTRLAGYRMSRSNRRLMRKNRKRYRVSEGPLIYDAEHEELYQRYLEIAPGKRSNSLLGSMLGGEERDRFATRELSIRDEAGRLVGFSAFDLGLESLQSLMGVYDPDHRKSSLGYWSLLLEVEHAIAIGLRYHYAGYVVPDNGSMDYKLAVGNIEFLHPDDGSWRPWDEVDSLVTPSQRLDDALHGLVAALAEEGVTAQVRSYRWFEAPAWSPSLEALLAEPRVVVLGDGPASDIFPCVSWSLDGDGYGLVLCSRALVHFESQDGDEREIEMWLTHDRLPLGQATSGAAAAVARLWRTKLSLFTGATSG